MAQVFISYKHDDSDFATILRQHIEKADFTGWIDDNLSAGDEWREMIDRALRESVALIVILSPEAAASPYVTYEWAFALGAGVPVIPVMLRRTEVHPRLEALHYLDFTHLKTRPWAELIDRLEAIEHKPGGSKRRAKAPQGSVALEAVREQLEDKHWDIRCEAVRALGDRKAGAAVPVLARMLATDRSVRVRAAAAAALGWIGDAAAVPDLGAALEHPHALVRGAAADALRRIGTDDARAALTAHEI